MKELWRHTYTDRLLRAHQLSFEAQGEPKHVNMVNTVQRCNCASLGSTCDRMRSLKSGRAGALEAKPHNPLYPSTSSGAVPSTNELIERLSSRKERRSRQPVKILRRYTGLLLWPRCLAKRKTFGAELRSMDR